MQRLRIKINKFEGKIVGGLLKTRTFALDFV